MTAFNEYVIWTETGCRIRLRSEPHGRVMMILDVPETPAIGRAEVRLDPQAIEGLLAALGCDPS